MRDCEPVSPSEGQRSASALIRSRALPAFAAALLASGCIPSLDLGDAPCPCAAGYHCCPIEDRCLPAGAVCPVSRNCPLPPTKTTLLDVGTIDPSSTTPAFVPLDGQGHLRLFRGPQGGYHIYVQIRMIGLNPTSVTLTKYVCDPAVSSCNRSTANRYQVEQAAFFCDADQDWILAQEQFNYMCPSRVKGETMDGRDLVLRVEAADGDGRSLTAQRTIHPDCPAGDSLCQNDNVIGCAAP